MCPPLCCGPWWAGSTGQREMRCTTPKSLSQRCWCTACTTSLCQWRKTNGWQRYGITTSQCFRVYSMRSITSCCWTRWKMASLKCHYINTVKSPEPLAMFFTPVLELLFCITLSYYRFSSWPSSKSSTRAVTWWWWSALTPSTPSCTSSSSGSQMRLENPNKKRSRCLTTRLLAMGTLSHQQRQSPKPRTNKLFFVQRRFNGLLESRAKCPHTGVNVPSRRA